MSLAAIRPIDIQRRLVELGRIRMGVKVAIGNGKSRPDKIDTWRMTSASERLLQAAADLYGGKVQRWNGAPDEGLYELLTTSRELDILIPPSISSYSQSYEHWQGGTLERRCDGAYELLGERPCVCDAADRLCKMTTRVNVMLPKLPGLGVWLLSTRGYNAAATLPATIEMAKALSGDAWMPAILRLEPASKRKRVDGKVQTHRWFEPRIDLTVTPEQIIAGGGIAIGPGGSPAPAIPERTNRRERVPRPALPPGPPPPTETQFRHGGAEDGGTPPGSPSAPPPDPEPFAPPPDVTDDGEVLSVDDPAPFLDRLRAVADANGGQASVASRDQKREVHELLEGLGTDAVVAVLLEALDRAEFAAITTGEAQAVLEVGASMGRDAFRDAWASAAIAIAIDDESGMGGVRE